MENQFSQYQDLEKIMITRDEIQTQVKEVAKRISADYQGKTPVVVCILKGAVMFFADLLRELDFPLVTDFMAISSYGSSTKSTGVVKLVKDLDRDICGRDVLVVEDIVDSGMTLSYIKKEFAQRGAASVRIATLLDKPARRRVELDVDYSCFVIPDAFVVGYGLTMMKSIATCPISACCIREFTPNKPIGGLQYLPPMWYNRFVLYFFKEDLSFEKALSRPNRLYRTDCRVHPHGRAALRRQKHGRRNYLS